MAALFLRACASGNTASVTAALARDASLARCSREGVTPLHVASSATVVGALVGAGADVLARDGHGRTPLNCAAASADSTTINALAQATAAKLATTLASTEGAQDACDMLGRSPAHWLGHRLMAATVAQLTAIAASAAEAKAPASASAAAPAAAPGLLEALLGASSSMTGGGETALHWAARAAAVAGLADAPDAVVIGTVTALCAAGVRPGVRTRDGKTAAGILEEAGRGAAAEAVRAAEAEAGTAPAPAPAPAAAVAVTGGSGMAGARRTAGRKPKRGRMGGLGGKAGGGGVAVSLKKA